jgi:hypothetical protein
MASALVLHRGGRLVSFDELAAVPVPPSAKRHHPIAHHTVLNRVKGVLGEFGYVVTREQLALARADMRFFGTLDLESKLAEGVTLAVGIRSSHDQSLHLGFCAGARTFVCDNSAFYSDLLVRRKHTRLAEQRFQDDIANAVGKLAGFQERQSARLEVLMNTEVAEERADALILRGYEKGLIPATLLSRVLKEWREPSFEEFKPRTYWSLQSCMTTVLGERFLKSPQKYAVATMRLNALVAPIDPSLN